MGGNTELHPAVLAGDPEAALVQVGQEAATGLVVGMRDVVAGLHALAGDLAYAGHTHLERLLVLPLAREAAAPPRNAAHDAGLGRAVRRGCCRWRAGIVLPDPARSRPGSDEHGPTGRSEP